MSTPSYSVISYDIDINHLIRRVYRGSIMEFLDFDEFYDRLVNTSSLELFSKDVCLFMSYGYRYLSLAERNDFVDLVVIHDDETDVFRNYALAIDYFMTTATVFFHALIAYELLRDTDIEDFMDKPNFKLVDVYSELLIFEYEDI